jgi:polysaccharide export outer membrane protein
MDQLFIHTFVRPLLMAVATAAALRLFRIHKPSVQHVAWTAVMFSMLMVPAWTILRIQANLPILPPVAAPAEPARNVPLSMATVAPKTPATPVGTQSAAAPISTSSQHQPDWRMLLLAIYLSGVSFFLIRLAVGTLLTVKVVRGATIQDGRLTSAVCASPATVGILQPVVILPTGWTKWPRKQLEAVLLHEREHARRHDPLIQWLALLNRAVFWFHPLAWWLEHRLSALAEDCCDDAVLAKGHDAHDYSAYLLDLARSVTNAGARLLSAGMVATGDRLLKRVRRICDSSRPRRSSTLRVGLATASCVLFCVVFSGFGLAHSTLPSTQMNFRGPAVVLLPVVESASSTRQAESANSASGAVAPEKSGAVRLSSETLVQSVGLEATQTSQVGQPNVAGITVTGNRRVALETILNHIHLKVGDTLIPDTVMNDVRALYALGEFDDIRVSTEAQGANSVIITFTLKEKPPTRPELLIPFIVRGASFTVLPTAPSQNVYVIKPKDVLNIVVWKEPVLSGKVAVRPDGRISVPLLQDVSAAGLTPEQLKVELEQRLASFLERPNVTVIVEEISSYRVYVIGAVQKSGEVSSEMPLTVVQAITMAGGFQDSAADHEIRIIRSDGTDASRFVVNVSKVTDGSDQPQNMYLKNGDVVFVR